MLLVKFDHIHHSSAIKDEDRKWLNERVGAWLPVSSLTFDDDYNPFVVAIRSNTSQLVSIVFLDYPQTIYTITQNDRVLYTNKKEDKYA